MHVPQPQVTNLQKRNQKIDALFDAMLHIETPKPLAKNMFMAKSEFEKIKQSNGN